MNLMILIKDVIMSKLSDKIHSDIKTAAKKAFSHGLNEDYIEDLIQKLVDISIKIEANQTDIESSGKEFQNYMYLKIH
jgi:hypothetical protein